MGADDESKDFAIGLPPERPMLAGVSLLDIHPSQALKNLADTMSTAHSAGLRGPLSDAAWRSIILAVKRQADIFGPGPETDAAQTS